MTQPAARVQSFAVPQHVAIIMDGNGRWAEERGLARLEGHRAGAHVVRDITVCARELGVPYLTLYSFSKQNWRRAPFEVAGLMRLLEDYCKTELPTLMQNDIRLTTIGHPSRLPRSTQKALAHVAQATCHNASMTLCLAVDYGGREEIVAACQRLVAQAAKGELTAERVSEQTVARALDTGDMPDPDLLIRTSGEQRVSNFLLWQLAYAEMHFTPVRWPDFSRAHFRAALADFGQRQRRFGHSEPAGPLPSALPGEGAHRPASERAGKDRPLC